MLYNNRADNLAEELEDLIEDLIPVVRKENPGAGEEIIHEIAIERARDELDYKYNRPEAVYY
jgi:hypothetical protein